MCSIDMAESLEFDVAGNFGVNEWDMSPGGHLRNDCSGTLSFYASHCNSIEDRTPADEIYTCSIFNWVAVI